MTHVSRKKLTKAAEKEIISALKSVFVNLTPAGVDKVFSTLVTETEHIMLAKRLAVVIMLSDNATYEEISNALNLTEQTISRIHFEMNSSPEVYKYLVSKLSTWKKKELLKAVLKEIGLRGVKLFAKHAGGRIY